MIEEGAREEMIYKAIDGLENLQKQGVASLEMLSRISEQLTDLGECIIGLGTIMTQVRDK